MNNTRTGGFTLLELMVVIVLITTVAGVAIANFRSGTPSALLKSESRKLISQLRQTRVKAITEGRTLSVDTGRDESGYLLIFDNQTITLPTGVSISMSSTLGGTGPDSEHLSFYPDGSSSGAKYRISSAAGDIDIDISWLTGEVSLNDHDN